MKRPMKLTDADQQLLSVLRENARASTAQISPAEARRSVLSPPVSYNRHSPVPEMATRRSPRASAMRTG